MSPNKFEKKTDTVKLREKAEARLMRVPLPQESTRSVDELLRELNVRQIEMEMQNDELRHTRQSRDHYADLYEFAPIAFLTLSSEGLINETNLAGALLLGDERKKISGKSFGNYVAPEHREHWHSLFLHTLKKKENHTGEFFILRNDGGKVEVRADAQYRQVGGNSTLCIALIDIAGHKQREQQLRLEEFALDHAHEAVYLIDANQRFVYVNAEACRALGYRREELLSLTVAEIDAHYSPAELIAVLDKSQANGTLRHETLHRRSDGSTFPVEIQSSIFEYQGQTMGVALARDISERKHYEMELKAAKKLLRMALEQCVAERITELSTINQQLHDEITERKNAEERLCAMAANVPGFIFTVRVEANGLTTFPFASRGVEDLFGVSPADLSRNAGALRARYHPDDLPRLLDLMKETEQTLGLFHIEIRIANRDNRYIWIEIRSMPKQLPEGGTEWHGIMLDITARKQAESDLEKLHLQLRGLLARNDNAREDERKRIAREMHDELGQILTGLQLSVSHLARQCAIEVPPLREQAEETILLTNQAVSVARNVAAALRPVELDSGIVAALELQAKRFSTVTGIQCTFICGENEIPLNENSALALYRIAQESLTNIAKHAKAHRVDISLSKNAADYVLKVCDDGIGFDTGDEKENTFGLLGIRERARMLGGTMSIDSRKGKGTEIRVRIPEKDNRD